MSGNLDDPRAKLDRAEHHYRFLREELNGGREFHERFVTVERHRDGLEYRFRVGAVEPLDSLWPVVVGDCLFNLRAALDQLVYQLHVRHFRGRVPDDAAQASAFPVLTSRRKDKKGIVTPERWKEIKRLGKRDRTAIEWLQPYRRGHGLARLNDLLYWERNTLAEVHELNRIDKHRHLHVVRAAVAAVVKPDFPPEYGFRSTPHWGPFDSNTEVETWTFAKAPRGWACTVVSLRQ